MERKFSIGNWIVDPEVLKLTKGEKEFVLEPRAMDLLIFLATHKNEVVSRDTLVENVWRGMFVSDHAVTSCIAKLRKVLSADKDIPKYIETVSKRGYRLHPDVTIEELLGEVDVQITEAEKNELPTREDIPNRNLQKFVAIFGAVFLVVTVAGYFSFFDVQEVSEYKTPTKQYANLMPVTFLPGEEEVPLISPNQKYLAFLYKAPSNTDWELRVKHLDKKDTYIVIKNVSASTLPAWSTSSDQLAFHRHNEQGCQIYVASLKWHDTMNVPQRKVADCSAHSIEMSFTWNKSNTSLYYSESESDVSPRRIYSLNVKTGKRIQITNPKDSGFGDYALKMSPDGNKLYFMRNLYWGDRTEFYTVSPQGGEITKITAIDTLIMGFTVDSAEQIIYPLGNTILNYDPVSSSTTTLLTSLKNIASLDISVDRNQIFFSAVSDNSRGIMLRNLMTGEEDFQIVQSSREEWAPRLSHTEDRFAFLSNRTGNVELYVSNLDGTKIVSTRLPANVKPSRVRWSYDDRWLLFDDNGQLHLVDSFTGEHEPLMNRSEHADVPNWSRDNSSVYFASDHEDDWQVYRFKDGEISTVTEYGGYEAEEGVNGEYLYYTKFRDTGVWRMPVKGGDEQQLLAGTQMLYDESFVVRGNSIVFKVLEDGFTSIKKLDLASNEVSLITQLDSANLRNFSLTDDASMLLFSKNVKARESDVVVARAN